MVVHYQPTGSSAAAISASVESGIRTGRLSAGATLPPVRTLAEELGVSPATVAAAYRTLRERGLVDTAGRAGTRVRARPPVAQRSGLQQPVPPGVLDLASGTPDTALLPRLGPHLRRLASVDEPVNYGGGRPLPELLELARQRFAADRVPAPHLTVTAGALDGIERAFSAHLRPGDRVGVEDPSWANMLDLISALGLTAVPIPVDASGPTEAGLSAALAAGVAAVVVTTRAQNPTGASVSAARARALRKILRGHPTVLVVEDDHAAELAQRPPQSLAGATESWAFARSVAKPYGPDLRLAVVAGDETTIARIEGRMRLGAGWVSTVLQRLVVRLWQDDAVAALVRRASDTYTQRREALCGALQALGGPAVHATSGINIWIPVPEETTAVAGLREAGYADAPGALYRIASPPAIRVTTAALRLSQARPLAEAIVEVLTGPAHRRRIT